MPSRLQLLGGPDAFPGAGDLDQDTLAVDARCLRTADQLAGLGEGGLGIEAQAGIHFGGDAAGNDLEDLAAEADEQLVHEGFGLRFGIPALLVGVVERIHHQVLVLRPLRRAEQQRRIGGCILRLEARDGLDIAGIRDYYAVFLQRIEDCHRIRTPISRISETQLAKATR